MFALPVERVPEDALSLLDLALADCVLNVVEHQPDPGQRLDCGVVEEEREPAPLLLLGGDQLVGEHGALGLAHLRLGEQPRVLGRAGRKVGEHPGANDVPALERLLPLESDRRDLLVPHAQGHDHGAVRRPDLAGLEQRCPRPEELFGLTAGLLEDPFRVEHRRDPPDRIDQRLEERGLLGERLLLALVPAPLPRDEQEGERGGDDDPGREAARGEPARADDQADDGGDRARDDGPGEDAERRRRRASR